MGRAPSDDQARAQNINQVSAKEMKAADCKFDSSDLQIAEGTFNDIMKHLSLSAPIQCGERRNELFVGTDVRVSVTGEHGIFKLTPVTMRIMGGKGTGNIDVNFAGEAPVYRVHYAVSQLQVGNLFKSLAPGPISGLVTKTKKLFGAKCTVFYDGSVRP